MTLGSAKPGMFEKPSDASATCSLVVDTLAVTLGSILLRLESQSARAVLTLSARSITPRLAVNARSMASRSVNASGVAVAKPVGTLP